MGDVATTPSRRWDEDTGIPDERRFAVELEFVQCLANPGYLNWLAQQRYFDDPAFIKYLEYLMYWMNPRYSKFIVYPHALFFLELVQHAEFRSAIADPNFKEFVHSQQLYFWQHFRNNLLRKKAEEGGEEEGIGERKGGEAEGIVG